MLVVPFLKPFQQYLSIPNEIVTLNNQAPIIVTSLGSAVQIDYTNERIHAIDSTEFSTVEEGQGDLIYGLLVLPIKKVIVSVLEDIKIIPDGQSIGVQLHTLGVL